MQIDFDKWLEPYTVKLLGVNARILVNTTHDRHSFAHSDIRSVTKQKQFLEFCENFNFEGYEVSELASQIIIALKNQTLKRMA